MNYDKSHLSPSQSATYLEMVIESQVLRAFPSHERVLALPSQIEEFLSCRRQNVVAWRSLLGRLSSLCLLAPGGRLRMRALQLTLLLPLDVLVHPTSRSRLWSFVYISHL